MIDNTRPPRTKRRDYTTEIIATGHSNTDRQKTIIESPKPDADEIKKKTTRTKDNSKRLKLTAAIVLIFAISSIGYLIMRPKPAPAVFPAQIANTVSYPIYYADDKADGYTYQQASATNRAGIIFYTLGNRKKNIIVSQQNAPTKPVNLSSLPKYIKIDVPIGQAVIGTGLGNPSIVIITPKTLIQITSDKGVTKDDITKVAQKMSLLNNQFGSY